MIPTPIQTERSSDVRSEDKMQLTRALARKEIADAVSLDDGLLGGARRDYASELLDLLDAFGIELDANVLAAVLVTASLFRDHQQEQAASLTRAARAAARIGVTPDEMKRVHAPFLLSDAERATVLVESVALAYLVAQDVEDDEL
ncbi:MAG TPA: hypothetical protein VNQ73_03395 [Ilumatobacter sp.]|nr:hypothetical protein [Ilumatobacter sp.]